MKNKTIVLYLNDQGEIEDSFITYEQWPHDKEYIVQMAEALSCHYGYKITPYWAEAVIGEKVE